jgi:DNA-directed RNA polymerase specialized sigma subunit
MTDDNKYKPFFEYRHLIDSVLQNYNPDTYDTEKLYDAGIAGLFQAIDLLEDNEISDFKLSALFHIKSEINKRITVKD